MDNDSELKPYFRFTVLVAMVHLLCAFAAFYFIWLSSQLSGTDAWIGFYALIPLALMKVTAPLSIISASFYFLKYKKDPIRFKIIVGLAFLSSLVSVFFSIKNT